MNHAVKRLKHLDDTTMFIVITDDKSCLLRPQEADNSIYFRVDNKSSLYFGILRNFLGGLLILWGVFIVHM